MCYVPFSQGMLHPGHHMCGCGPISGWMDGISYQNGRHNDDRAHPSNRRIQAASFGDAVAEVCYVLWNVYDSTTHFYRRNRLQ